MKRGNKDSIVRETRPLAHFTLLIAHLNTLLTKAMAKGDSVPKRSSYLSYRVKVELNCRLIKRRNQSFQMEQKRRLSRNVGQPQPRHAHMNDSMLSWNRAACGSVEISFNMCRT